MSRGAVVLSAHHCAPGMGSEHAVGWNYLRELSRDRRIILITQDNEFRAPIEQEVGKLRRAGASISMHFVRHDARTDGRKNNLRVFYYLSYIAYQWRVYRLVKELCKSEDIIALHHLTIVGFREPGFLWLLDRPFIWGPVGGLVFAPRSMFGLLSPKMRAFQFVRNAITAVQFYTSIRVRLAYSASQRRGGSFIAATQDIGQRFAKAFGGRFIHVPETGARESHHEGSCGEAGAVLKLLWVGGLIDIKPLNLLLEAIARVDSYQTRIELDVIGDGDSRARFAALSEEYGIKASFHGWLPYEEVQAHYQRSDLFVLFSMKDLTTNVVFESLAGGLPVLCLDHHGYSEIVDESCGFKVTIGSLQGMTGDIAEILERLGEDKKELSAKSEGALRKAAEFTWARNGDAIRTAYAAAECAGPSVSLKQTPPNN